MKKLLLMCAIVITQFINAQSIVDESKKLSDLAGMLTANLENSQKLDSLIAETEKLYESSTSLTIRKTAKEMISAAKDFKNSIYTSKIVKTSFETLDQDLQKKYKYEYDKFKKVGFINAKRDVNDRIKIYISIKNNKANLRMVTKYIGNGWLFFNKAIFIIDGKNYEYDAPSADREVLSGANVEESTDLSVDENMLSILNAISNSQNTVEYRLSGEKYSNFKLMDREKENISLVLNLYKKLTQ